jgi:hypothetical protein
MQFAESNAKYAGLPRGMVRGKIVDVDDPENCGRVRVLFDAMNPEDIPEIEGAGVFSCPRDGVGGSYSHWIDASPAFVGKQPPSLIGSRVNIILSNGQYHYAILSDTIYDPQNLTGQAAGKLTIPNSSAMTRLPIYPAGSLPPPCQENRGCTVVEDGGPMSSDWVCVCLKRNGEYIWVRHCDLQHGHAGANDSIQPPDSSGNRQNPSQAGTVSDYTFPTSGEPLKIFSAFGNAPRGNPYGQNAIWHSPPMSDKPPRPIEQPQLLDMGNALSFVRKDAGYPDGQIKGAFTTKWNPSISAALPAIPGVNFAAAALKTGQKALSVAGAVGKIIEDPLKFVQSTALATSQSLSPQTSFVINAIQNPKGTIITVYTSLASALNPFK